MTIYNSINNGSQRGVHNTILGLGAGNSTYDTNTCIDNTCYGYLAGRFFSASASNNCLFGSYVGANLNMGGGNALFGFRAGILMTDANANIGIGDSAIDNLTSGILNICVGRYSGTNYVSTESSNICIGNSGTVNESNVINIGTSGSGPGQQNICKIAGISTNLVTDGTPYRMMVLDQNNDTIKSITQQNLTSPIVTVYSTPGNYTWTKNANTKYVTVYGWCGGSGGGSGSKYSDANNAGGGGGGNGSAFYVSGPALMFGATESLSVGAGGNGGAAVTTDSTDGNPGQLGGYTFFGALRPFISSTAGGGGGNNVGGGGGAAGTVSNDGGNNIDASGGGDGSQTSGSPGIAITGSYPLATGGGGGAGGANVLDSGGAGGSIYAFDGSTLLSAGGAGGATHGVAGDDGAPYRSNGGLVLGGTGGGGGGSHGGAGGRGGQPGGGGGGGGAGLNSFADSGPGGAGGDGMVIVIEFR